jgi:D-alanine-D-alanine ligase
MKVAIIHNRDQSGVINVFGPQNRERYNPKTVERVAAALEKGGHNVRIIDGNMHVIDQLRDFMPRVMAHEGPGMVFNMAYGIQGVSRYTHLPAMLEMLGVPYVGSNPLAHGLALDKVIAKIVFQNAGLPTARFWNFASAEDRFDDLTFPLIVKPKMEAVSYGVKVVYNEEDLREAVDYLIKEFQQHVLVEQFIPGREFAIGLLGNGEPEVFPIVELDLAGDPNAIQSAEEKLHAPLQKICPAPLPEEKAEELRALARKAFRSLDLFDFARVDVRMDREGNPYILEINSMASLGLTGTYVRAAQEAAYSYEALINRIVDVAVMRYFGPDSVSRNGASDKSPAAEKGSVSARMRSYLRSQAGTIEDSLERMVEMRTPATDPERVNAFGEWITSQLEGMGFKVKAYPGVNVGLVLYFTNHDGDTNDVLLLSHLDVAAGPEHLPFRSDETRLYGAGIAESKGGIAVALAALRALRWARALRRVKCGILLTTDDTLNGARARPIVEELAPRSRHIIGLKAGDPDGGLTVSRSGRATYTIEADYPKTRGNVSQADAVTHLTGRVLALQALTNAKAGIRIGVTHIDLKAAFGRPPDKAEAGITVRFESASAASTIDERVRAVAQEGHPKGIRVHVTGMVRRPPMKKSKANQQLFDDVARIAARMNVTVKPVHRPSSSDICFAPASIPKIDGMGPIGEGVRTPDERVFRYSLVERAALLANVLLFLATGSEP